MTEGSPVMINNPTNPAVAAPAATSGELSETPVQELVIAYTPRLPPQLEHWLRKRTMRLHLGDPSTIDAGEIRSMNARYIILDLDALPADRSAIEVVRMLRAQVPDIRILVTTVRSDDNYSRGLTEAGANGVIIKQPYVADLVFALQAASEGRTYVSGVATERERAAVQITAREREVLELMANGHSNQAIGERLSISVKTVEAHRARLFKKLGASNVADAVLLAIRTGLVMP